MSLKKNEMTPDDLHLEHAPIVEALIVIDVEPLNDETMSRVQTVAEGFRTDYPESEPLRQSQFKLGMDLRSGGIISRASDDASFGRKYVSKDKRQLVVFRRDGFNFSRLPPYERWDSFRSEAKRLWKFYRSATGPAPIVRFGLRFINRVFIPFGRSISEFLKMYPELPNGPDGSSLTVNSSYMRVDSALTEPRGQLIIQQATLPAEREGFATLSLDFDLSFIPIQGSGEEYVWDTLESARHIKNQLFVDSLTPSFLETFQ
jgi:uncharacterized protein (TIGR04255 family)